MTSARWVDGVRERGFAVCPDRLGGAEVDGLLHALESAPLNRSRAGARHALAHPAVQMVANDARLRDTASAIMGGAAHPFRATLFDKAADANWLVVWHQDTALPLRARVERSGWGPWSVKAGVLHGHAPATALHRVVALRLHLDESTLRNGPLRVLPGSHELGLLSDDAIRDLSTQVPAESCIASRGALLAMRPLLVHSSSKSTSAERRRVLHIEYADAMVLDDGAELAVS